MAAAELLRSVALVGGSRLNRHRTSYAAGFIRQLPRPFSNSARLDEGVSFSGLVAPAAEEPRRVMLGDDPEYRQWRDKEEQILEDVGPTISLAKDILHSNRYGDGERLSAEDEEAVIEKLLVHHPCAEDKVGCGLHGIMVDRHPRFRWSRCLFVVRTDGGWIDFSYQKCLRGYLRARYPDEAERFIKEHFKRS